MSQSEIRILIGDKKRSRPSPANQSRGAEIITIYPVCEIILHFGSIVGLRPKKVECSSSSSSMYNVLYERERERERERGRSFQKGLNDPNK